MGNNKKSARSSRGRSNYVKTIQRSQPKAKRIRRKEEEVDTKPKKKPMSPILTGLIFGATFGVFVGTTYNQAVLGSLIGGLAGALVGCIVDLVQTKRAKKEEK